MVTRVERGKSEETRILNCSVLDDVMSNGTGVPKRSAGLAAIKKDGGVRRERCVSLEARPRKPFKEVLAASVIQT